MVEKFFHFGPCVIFAVNLGEYARSKHVRLNRRLRVFLGAVPWRAGSAIKFCEPAEFGAIQRKRL
jgi:hypothetical protein